MQAGHMDVCREISGLDPCEQALTCLFHFVRGFLIFGGRFGVWEMTRHHAVLQVQEREGTGWCPCTKWEICLYLHLFCFRPYSSKFIKTTMFLLAEAKSLLFDSQVRKSGGHQLVRHMSKSFVPEIRSANFWYELEGSCTCSCWVGYPWHQLPGSPTTLLWKGTRPLVSCGGRWMLESPASSDSELHLRAAFQGPSQLLAMSNSQPAENLILYRVGEDKAAGRH